MKKTDFELIEKYMNEPAEGDEHASWQILLLAYNLLQSEYKNLSSEDYLCISSAEEDYRLISNMAPDMNKVSALKVFYDRVCCMPEKVQYHMVHIREGIWNQITEAYEEMRKKIMDIPHPHQNIIDLMNGVDNSGGGM